MTDLFLEVYDDPEGIKKAAKLCADLLKEFLVQQKNLIGDALASPGHGFASSRVFTGLGLSNDIRLCFRKTITWSFYRDIDEELAEDFGGFVYHSCGVWEQKINMVKGYRNIKGADGAFNHRDGTLDRCSEAFADAFAGTGIVLNARAVGNPENSFAAFEKLWRPNQKLIAVTYCKTVEEQEELYRRLHEMEERSL